MKPTLIISAFAILGAVIITVLTLQPTPSSTAEGQGPSEVSLSIPPALPMARISMERIETAGGTEDGLTARRAVDLLLHVVREVGPGGKLTALSAPEGVDVGGKSSSWDLSFEVLARNAHIQIELRPCGVAMGSAPGSLCAQIHTQSPPPPGGTTLPAEFRDSSRAVQDLIREGKALGEDARSEPLAAVTTAAGQTIWRWGEGSAETAFTQKDAHPPRYFVLLHSPGRSWQEGTPGMQQPGIQAHVGYWAGHLQTGRLAQGGPFLDDTGGIMILNVPSIEEASRLAEADPTVQSGLLRVAVKPWLAPLGGS